MSDDPLVRLGSALRDELDANAGPPPVLGDLQRRRTVRRAGVAAAAAAIAAVVVAAVVAVPRLFDDVDAPTIEPVAPSEEPAPVEPRPDGAEVHDLDVDLEVEGRLLAVRFNNPSLAVVELDPGRTVVYPPGSHGLAGDAIDGALVGSDGTVTVWQDGTVRVFADGLDEPSWTYTPDELINPPEAAPALRVWPTDDGQALWVVQIGSCCPDEFDGLAELVDLTTGEVRTTVTLPPATFPVGNLGDDLLLNTEELRLAGTEDAGWVTDPGSLRVVRLSRDGELDDVTDGHAVAASGSTVLVQSCHMETDRSACSLDLLDTTTGRRRSVASPEDGSIGTAAGPAVPGDFTPWEVVAPDGRILAAVASQGDGSSSEPSASRLVAIDPDTAEVTELARFDGPPPPAAWDRDGHHVVVVDDRDLVVIDPTSDASVTLEDAIPDDHHVVGVG